MKEQGQKMEMATMMATTKGMATRTCYGDKEGHSDGGGHHDDHHEEDGHQDGVKDREQEMEMATMMATMKGMSTTMKGWPPGEGVGTRRVVTMEVATTTKGVGTRVGWGGKDGRGD